MNKIMLLVLVFIFTNCENQKKTTKTILKTNRFSNELDTIYKSNALEIEHITRTFYKKGSEKRGKLIKVQRILGEDNIRIIFNNRLWDSDRNIYESKGIGMVTFKNMKEFEKFLDDIEVFITNPTKRLIYDLTYNGYHQGNMFNSVDGIVTLIFKGLDDEVGSIDIDKIELDSLRSCYNRYKIELGNNIHKNHN